MSASLGNVIGASIDRSDGALKVVGQARYAAEFNPSRVAHAVMVQSTEPSGRIATIDTVLAQRMPGVLKVLTHMNAPRLPEGGRAAVEPPAGRVKSLLQDDWVHYNGQPVALVVAERFEQAVDAAAAVRISYASEPPELNFARARAKLLDPVKTVHEPSDRSWGDVDAGLAQADLRFEATYTTPMEHHNPIEPHATVAEWSGNRLTLYDSTQYVAGVRDTVAKTLGISPEQVRVVSPFVGGGFGSKGSTWSHVVLAAMAAREVGRPVKLALSRPQMFGPVGGRPRTEQRIVLGATRAGLLTAVRHDVVSHTSVMELYVEPAAHPTRALYAAPSGATTHRVAKLNVGVPTFQRAPGEATGSFALESAMDELAAQLGVDPLQLRLANYALREPSSGRPWSSKRLREAYALGAERFGWDRRPAAPRSLRDGRWRVGWGMATASYPAHRMAAAASARLEPDGRAVIRSATHDLGTGTYTILTQIAAETLELPVARVRVEIGDTDLPKAPVSGGSMTAASVGSAVRAACLALRGKIAALPGAGSQSPAEAVARHGESIEATAESKPGEEEKRLASRSFGAVFLEARIDPELGLLRVPRIVGAYSVGRVLNEKLARSQLQGGIVWGLGMAMFEESILDERVGRFANGNLAEYHIPVNADVGEIDVQFVDESDEQFSPLGARGIGEIGITGVPAALANAVFHATGRRIRDLPITLDKLL